MTLMPISDAEREYRRRWGWTDSNPGPVSLPKLLFEDDHARRLEAERDDAADREGDAAITGGAGAGDLIGDAAGDRLADHGGGQDRHWFSPPAIGDDGEIVVTGRKPIPDSQKYVLVGGKYYPNPHYDPPFDISLEQAIGGPPLAAGAAAFLPEATVVIAGALKAARAVKSSKAADLATKYVKQGFSRSDAEELAKPYSGIGHHFIPKQRRLFPKISKILNPNNRCLPSSFIESRFNVLRPKGISKGEMYELHYKVDPNFKGTTLPGGTRWSGRDIGLKKYEQAGRLWYGSPTPLKASVGGVSTVGGGAAYLYKRDKE
ncbi:hypothetical protein Swit_4444 [Rhizorhabdus wittichii RW1]|uniref:Uncharacterized protein n=1 Tax=Rhizorhabdus wittichii (strain DSM 6014 / CCUG 31198 / JCM 15750 / NBRC 105917 / EY 4224 / RW1) TaxID=392499 RepID=A0A9J9HFV1_RHIWR|nr:hypothetical protein Swit_4444 [Rhizorhabdus wittichii RW1]